MSQNNQSNSEDIFLNGFSIISFNTDIDLSSIKYENYEFKKDNIENVSVKNINSNLIQTFSNNDSQKDDNTEYLGIEKYWLIINENDSSNLIIIKNQYLDNFDNIFRWSL